MGYIRPTHELTPNQQIVRRRKSRLLADRIINEVVARDYPWLLHIDKSLLGDNPERGFLVKPKRLLCNNISRLSFEGKDSIIYWARFRIDNYIEELIEIYPQLREPFTQSLNKYRIIMPNAH